MAIFENPNNPVQPQKGVYGWYAEKAGQATVTIYIGAAGQKETPLPKGTLFRGVSELQRNLITSNSPEYTALDTDFIVGTAILYFENKGYKCLWKHISNNPADENGYVQTQKPILQNTTNSNIRDEFKIKKTEHRYWKARHIKEGIIEAEKELFAVLDEVIAK